MTKLRLLETPEYRRPQPTLAPLLIVAFVFSLPLLFIIYTVLGV